AKRDPPISTVVGGTTYERRSAEAPESGCCVSGTPTAIAYTYGDSTTAAIPNATAASLAVRASAGRPSRDPSRYAPASARAPNTVAVADTSLEIENCASSASANSKTN